MVKRLCLMGGLILCLGALIFGTVVSGGQAAAGGEPAALEGKFHILWGDGAPGSGLTQTRYFLATPQFGSVQLQISPEVLAQAGDWLALNGQTITVNGHWLLQAEEGGMIMVDALALAHPPEEVQDVIGSQPWISIMCKFSDVPAEPQDLLYFQGMFSSKYPGLDHYWREQSYELINLDGSGAFGWYTLPHTRTYYLPGGNLDWWTAAAECAAVADADIYFPDYVGINLMFNDVLDCCAWGGSWTTTLDGVTRAWRTTWEPPWGYNNVGVIAHETGHGFGLPHSNWGDIGYVYDNEWDVMSDLWANNSTHPTYGTLGQHTIAFHKAMLGWIPSSQIVTVDVGQIRTVTLERLALPGAAAPLTLRVPINGASNYFYTVEVRQQVGNYDIGLPGNAVIIHEVLTSRYDAPAFLMGTNGGLGGAWTPGETFSDAAHGIEITVVSATASGFVVTVRNQFEDITGVILAGPAQAYAGDSVTLTATVSPANASLPVTYLWEASGQPPLTRTNGVVDTAQFQWSEPGTQTITVTVNNGAGSFSDTHNVLIQPIPLQVTINGPREILVNQPYTFTASSILNEGTLPITYTWHAAGLPPVTHTAGLTDAIEITWPVTGTQTITLTARNGKTLATNELILYVLASPLEVSLNSPQQVWLNRQAVFTAVSLYEGVEPILYTWQASGQAPFTHTSGLTDTAVFLWSEPATYIVTATAQTSGFWDRTEYSVTVQVMGPQSLMLDGLSNVDLAQPEYRITAYLFPLTTTLPVTYIWQVDGAAVLTHTGTLSDTLVTAWAAPGMHTITVTAYNHASSVQATLDVAVYRRTYLPLAVRGE